jgi:hypothetical protein
VKKRPSSRITTLVPIKQKNGTQAADDPKLPFHLTSPRDLDLARGFESELFIILVLARKPFSQ